MEVIGIVWTMLGLKPEWRLFRSRAAQFVIRMAVRFKKPAAQVVHPKTLESTITFHSGAIGELDKWPSDPAQQIAELKGRIEAERARVEGRFSEVTKRIGESEARMARKVDDAEEKLSGLADDLDLLQTSNWGPRLGGPLLAGTGVVFTALGNIIG